MPAVAFGLTIAALAGWAFADPYLTVGSYVPWGTALLGPALGLALGALLAPLIRLLSGPSCAWLINALMLLLLAAALIGPALLRYLNMTLDTAPGAPHSLEVVEHKQRSKSPDKIVLRHWADPADTFEIEGSYPQGASIQVIVHEGNLGLTWVETPLDVHHNAMKRQRR